jgi:adenylate cyclase
MALEIERKFLVVGETWRDQVESSTHIMQGYIASSPEVTVRVRVKGDKGFLTIKGISDGIRRHEFEYPIPVEDAEMMLRELAVLPPIDKVRHDLRVGEHLWELDVFAGENEGLVMAEIELSAPDEPFLMPAWAGEEVSEDLRYYNVQLAKHPYRRW